MNNGVTNTNQTNDNSQPTLTPMEGVKIAPADPTPINASSTATAAAALSTVKTTQTVQQPASPTTPAQPQQVQPATVAQATTTPAQSQPIQPASIAQTTTATTQQPEQQTTEQPKQEIDDKKTKPKKKTNITPILILIILGLGAYMIYTTKDHKEKIEKLTYNCTPITASKEETKLDINSTLVQDLYSKVKTNIREDIAEPNFNNSMKLYLAYRQVKENDKYDSNCNLFNVNSMEPFTCEVTTNFMPKAFKEEILQLEIKKLFGEKTDISLANIQLGSSCIGGYQYIPQRGEFVQGYCNQNNAISYKVDKKITEATNT